MSLKIAKADLSEEEARYVRALVLYEDDAVIALTKPPGLASQGGRGGGRTLDDLLCAFARSNGKRPDLVHRLDRDTSGVILAAKTKPAAGFLGKALMGRRVTKIYLALTARAPDPQEGLIDACLRREEQGRQAEMRVCACDHPDAQTAQSRYRTLSAAPGGAALELRPKTGRMHQLRVHLAHIERPILGDGRYGGALTANGGPVPRLMLHAMALEFPHPEGGRTRITAPAPEDFQTAAQRAGLVLPIIPSGRA
jgi:tRNA pseudouridine32 synthase/23S rRNA pseudouridine746 synthase